MTFETHERPHSHTNHQLAGGGRDGGGEWKDEERGRKSGGQGGGKRTTVAQRKDARGRHCTNENTEGATNLVSALAALDVNDFALQRERATTKESAGE